MPMLKVFSGALKHLKDAAINLIPCKHPDIHWVITVPAIWEADARQFMREAAKDVSSIDVYSIIVKNQNALFGQYEESQ